jgi:alpha-D-xyloside xylohydrolase
MKSYMADNPFASTASAVVQNHNSRTPAKCFPGLGAGRSLFAGLMLALSASLVAAAPEATVKSVVKRDAEVQIAMGDQTLVLRPLADNAIRVRLAASDAAESPSLVLTEKVPTPKFKVNESKETVTVATAKMKVVVDRGTGGLNFQDAAGKTILTEKPDGRSLKSSVIRGEPTFAVQDAFVSPPDEGIFGTGEFQDGELNIRDLPRRLTQVNCQIAIPFLLSSKGYGLLWHNYGLTDLNLADGQIELVAGGTEGAATTVEVTTTEGTKKETRRPGEFTGKFTVKQAGRQAFLLDVGQKMARRWHVEIDDRVVVDFNNFWLPPTTSWHTDLAAGEHTILVKGEVNDRPKVFFRPSVDETVLRSPVAEALDYVVFAGKPDEVIATYRQLTGPAPLMPEWALGYIHCRERFHSQQELLDNAREFRKRNLPMDVMVQDWQYWGKYGWNAMQWDEKDYPDPAAMVRELHAMNARLMVSVWSKIDPKSEVGKEFAARKYFIPGTQWVDFFNPDAAALYWKNFSARMLSLGIDAWWQDATEPENDDLVGRKTYLGSGEKVRDIYPLFVTKTVYEGQRKDAPDKRVCILTRSAFSGEQRYAAATWSGDIGNDWDTLRRQIPAGLNFMAAGLPYWTTDCGGFFRPGGGQYTDAGYHERFLRWFQYATFCPLQRVHGYQTDTEFWRFGPEVEKVSHDYLDLRYRLLPYIYSEASRVTFDGSTLMRPLVMDFADDAAALEQKYEFMFGPAFLVSPVLQGGATNWDVYLPKAAGGWFDFWTGEKLAGGQTVKVAAPLAQIPLHVRAGSIIPIGPTEEYTGEKPANPIELRIYPGADGAFTLYEDEGDNYNYERDVHATIPISWSEKNQTLTIGKRDGKFPGMLPQRKFRIVFVLPNHGVGGADTEKADVEVIYKGSALKISAH